MNGRTWIMFQKTIEIVRNIQNIPDIKNLQAPRYMDRAILYVNCKLLKEDCKILDAEISQTIDYFRNALFIFITEKQKEILDLARQDDHEFIQNSLILLDERLKKHYPLKGQIEVEIYQNRSAQITDHKQRYERNARQVLDQNQL